MIGNCRTCLSEIRDFNFIPLSSKDPASIILQTQLSLCVPEMILDAVTDPVMCQACVTALHAAASFKCQCIQAENRIQDFLQSKNNSEFKNNVLKLEEMFPVTNEVFTFVTITQNSDDETNYSDEKEVLEINESSVSEDADVDPLGLLCVYTEMSVNDCNYEHEIQKHVEKKSNLQNLNRRRVRDSKASSTVCEEMYSLKQLGKFEEQQLQFNCILLEENELPSRSCSLEQWSRFEETYHLNSSKETSHANNFLPQVPSSSPRQVAYHECSNNPLNSALIKSLTPNNNEEIWLPHCSVVLSPLPVELFENATKASKAVRSKKQKYTFGTSTSLYNSRNNVKYKRKRYKKSHKHLKSLKQTLKCDECEYKTKLRINLELHSIAHITLPYSECDYNNATSIEEESFRCLKSKNGQRFSKSEHSRVDESFRNDGSCKSDRVRVESQ